VSAASPAPGLAERFTRIVRDIQAMVAHRIFMPQNLRQRDEFALFVMLWKRLNVVIARFAVLASGGAVSPPAHNSIPTAHSRRPSLSDSRLPRQVGWLIRLFGGEAMELGADLKALFATPEFVSLLHANPEVGQLLRPLCRLLCITRSWRLPPALFTPIPAKPKPALATPARHIVVTPAPPRRTGKIVWRWTHRAKALA
jgi:hypothetical protein